MASERDAGGGRDLGEGGRRGQGRARSRRLVVSLVITLLAAAVAAVAAFVFAPEASDDSGELPPSPEASRRFEAVAGSAGRETAIVWAVGDGADGGREAAALASRIAATRPSQFLYLGDVYENGTSREFERNYKPVYGRLESITAPTPGNHDWPRAHEGYNAYWRRALGFPIPSYYSFRAGGWELLSLNSEISHDEGSRQLRWLHRELSERGSCRLAYLHRPRFSAGRHGDQPDIEPLWRALVGRAAVVVAGHDHNMQRLRPIDGVTTFVSGAGGKSHYDLDDRDRRLAFSNEHDDGALRFDLRPGTARYAFISSAGKVLDSGAVRCRR